MRSQVGFTFCTTGVKLKSCAGFKAPLLSFISPHVSGEKLSGYDVKSYLKCSVANVSPLFAVTATRPQTKSNQLTKAVKKGNFLHLQQTPEKNSSVFNKLQVYTESLQQKARIETEQEEERSI